MERKKDHSMVGSLLGLSNSRALLFAAVGADTVCVGSLALFLTLPLPVLQNSSTLVLFLSLAITVPVLTLIVGGLLLAVPSHFDEEERARRALLAGTVLHFGVQISSILGPLGGCKCGPTSPAAYVLETLLKSVAVTVLICIGAGLMSLRRSAMRKRERARLSDLLERSHL